MFIQQSMEDRAHRSAHTQDRLSTAASAPCLTAADDVAAGSPAARTGAACRDAAPVQYRRALAPLYFPHYTP
jgi:hypothetical protein